MTLITALDQLNHDIPLSQAVEMTRRYRQMREEILKPEYQGQDILPLSETFNRNAFDKLLAQTGCAGIRAYLGMDSNNLVKLIFVGVNAANEDILSSDTKTATRGSAAATTEGEGDEEDGDVEEEGQRCPPLCPPSSPLNQP